MKIILSPAKKMNIDLETLEYQGLPVFLEQTKEIMHWLQGKSYEGLKKLWGCNDKIAKTNEERLKVMDFVCILWCIKANGWSDSLQTGDAGKGGYRKIGRFVSVLG